MIFNSSTYKKPVSDVSSLVHLLGKFSDSMQFLIRELNSTEDSDCVSSAVFRCTDNKLVIKGIFLFTRRTELVLSIEDLVEVRYDFDVVVIIIKDGTL